MSTLFTLLPFIGGALLVLALVLGPAIKTIQQYERGILFRFGRLVGLRQPGLNFILPWIDRLVKVDMRVVTMTVEPQEVITRDNVTIKVDAVVYFQVVNPTDAILKVADFTKATSQVALTTLRSVLGQSDLDELLAHREAINLRLQQIIDEQTEPWGVKVTMVETKDVLLPESLQRAMARQAEAEREKRAKIIHAEGEYKAAKMLAQAGGIIASEPITLQLRYLQTLTEMAGEHNSTIIPLPLDIIGAVNDALRQAGRQGDKVTRG